MKSTWRLVLLFGLPASIAFGQLTMDQKIADFQQTAGLYAKRYGPYEWKRDVIGFDLLDISPWLTKVIATKDDLDFYEVISEYVSKLNDAHDVYQLPANFIARLNFSVDIYDGRLLVDFIDRTRLPAAEFPFLIGYELVSIDGQDAKTTLQGLLRYEIAANPRGTSRLAAGLLTTRPQVVMPHAANVPEISTVVFRRPDSQLETYRIPWAKSGVPLTVVGKYLTPQASRVSPIPVRRQPVNLTSDDPPAPGDMHDYLALLERLQNCRIPDRSVVSFGSLTPVFAQSLPPSFVLRLGKSSQDPFYSGVFQAGGFKIGFIRIPSYSPANTSAALTAFQSEMAYFQANTDGLVIDDMRNPGGSGSYVNQILSLVMTGQWSVTGFELRATSEWVVAISSALEQAKALGPPQEMIDLYTQIKSAIVDANSQFRGRTQPIPLDTGPLNRAPATDSKGNVIAYTKPLIVLVDELSASAAEIFAAGIQDNSRGPLVGWRTMGAGGNVENWEAGSYSLGITSVTESLMNRGHDVVTSDYPAAPYVENIGVRPDVPVDYMTGDNLVRSGQPFVDAFVAAIVDQILKRR
jgi:hypothetical protein